MFKQIICIALLSSVPALPQGIGGALGGLVNRARDQVVPQNSPQASNDNDEGTIEDYLEMRAFAGGLYNQLEGSGENLRQSAFKRRVDTAVEEARKADQQLAYQMNTSAKSEVRRVVEDRYRVYSGLYDSPVVQALVNRIGQSIVSKKVSRYYTFKLIVDPLPRAESLSTGTVWISTGLVALMKSKSEMAYVLAHEAAHIYLEHHRTRILLQLAQEEYNKQLEENGESQKKRARAWGSLIQLGGQMTNQQQLGNLGASVTTGILSNGAATRGAEVVEWNRFEEDEADRLALDWVIDSPADVEQIPKVFSKLRDLGGRDPGVALGFLGRSDHIRERLSNLENRLKAERAKPTFAGRAVEPEDPDFTQLLAEVQRDNGVAAFHYDMLETARANLEEAVLVKTQDPTVLYFYAKILLQTARTEADRDKADEYFKRAADYDYRNQNYGSYLHRAVRMLTQVNATAADKRQAVALLKEYVLRYHLSNADDQSDQMSELPPHLDAVYDYMARAGELKWTVDDKILAEARKKRDAGSPLVTLNDGGRTAIDTTPPKPKPEPEVVKVVEPVKPPAAPPKATPPKTAPVKPTNGKE
jgi:predicted Zn-dependent protease